MVFPGKAFQLLKLFHAAFIGGENRRPALFVRYVQFIADLVHHFASRRIEFRFVCARDRVVARMDHTGVRLAGSGTDVVSLLQDQHIQFIS